MKKLALILVLLTVGFTATSQTTQDSTELITYEITATGYSNGLIIPSPHYISITGFDLNRDGAFYYVSVSQTYMDTLNVETITNDSLNYSKRYYIPAGALGTYTPLVIFNNTVKSDLESIYGAQNVTKIR